MAGQQPKAEELVRRMAIVQKTIGDRGWSLMVQRALAAEFGVCMETVGRYRRRLIDGMKIELDERTREEKQAEFIERLQGHQRAALAAGRLGPLAAMMNLESKIVGVEVPSGQSTVGSVEVVLKVPKSKKKKGKK
jgi:hypothetical protein